MADIFFDLTKDQQRDILEGAESKLGIEPYLIEKDLWICWVLNVLFTFPQKMAFKGGTSLSKCYGLIDRFSEDLDITIDYREFMPELDLKDTSKSAIKRKREELQNQVKNFVKAKVISTFEQKFTEEFRATKFKYKLDEDGEKLWIYYPFVTNKEGRYIDQSVLIEFGGANKTEPYELHDVKPMLLEISKGLTLPIAKNVKTLCPKRTFWEKVTLIHVECHRGRLTTTPDRLSRHWYDLAQLYRSEMGSNALRDKELLHDVLTVKKAFYNSNYANYEKCENANFQLVPNSKEIDGLKSDYNKMIEAKMFSKEPPVFEKIIESLQSLQEQLNQVN